MCSSGGIEQKSLGLRRGFVVVPEFGSFLKHSGSKRVEEKVSVGILFKDTHPRAHSLYHTQN